MRFLMIFNHCVKWPFYRILWYILSDLVICSKLDTMQWTGSRRLVILKLWNSVLLFSHLLWRKTFWWIIAGCQVQEHEGSLRVHTLQHTAAPLSDIAVLLIVRPKLQAIHENFQDTFDITQNNHTNHLLLKVWWAQILIGNHFLYARWHLSYHCILSNKRKGPFQFLLASILWTAFRKSGTCSYERPFI